MYTFKYHFEGSSSIWTIESEKSKLTSTELCDLILKNIFKDQKATCGIQCNAESIEPNEVYIITRDYVTFNKVNEVNEVKKTPQKKRARRWRSRSPQRQMRPIYNYRYY